MSCEACCAAASVDDNRVASINASVDEVCGCEKYSISEFSPGKVTDDEVLCYLVPTPEGRTENGKLNPTFLMQVDRNGLSVLRDRAEDKEFELTAEQLRPRWATKNRTLEGIMLFPVSSVRYFEESRQCCVYDTAQPEKPSHADLMMPVVSYPDDTTPSQKKHLDRARLKKLVDSIGANFQNAAEFRDGRLKHLADT